MKKILIISASPRKNGNSDILCQRFEEGAKESGHQTKMIFLGDKKIGYCRGCNGCNQTGECVQNDHMKEILQQLIEYDVIVLSTPVYFYSINAQMKAMIDRTYPRYKEIVNKDFYFIMTAAVRDNFKLDRALETFRGFTQECLPGSREAGVIYGTGVWLKGDVKNTPAYNQAYRMGKDIK